jgi:hypothetical protein
MFMTRLLVLALFVMMIAAVAGCGDNATEPGSGSELPGQYGMLLTASMFKGAHVGYGGFTPPEVIAFRGLLESPDADGLFKRLLEDATTPGALYALCGIYFTDPGALPDLTEPYLESSGRVMTFFGCIQDMQAVSAVAEDILAGSIPLELKGSETP